MFRRLKVALCNILRGGGGNDSVEENLGAKHRSIKIGTVLRKMEKDNNDSVIDLEQHYNEINRIDDEEDIMI